MKNRYGVTGVVLALALPFMASMAWAEEAGKTGVTEATGGGINCMMQQDESAKTGCRGHASAATVDEPENLFPCSMTEVAAGEMTKAAARPAMDGRAGGWPRNHGKHLSSAKSRAKANPAGTQAHGGCS